MAPRYQAAAGECSLLTCLNQYTAPELLAGNYKFGCDACTELRNRRLPPAEKGEKRGTVYSNANKQLLIYSPPPVLTIHLKRFEVCSFSLRKVNRHVQFGERLDLAPFCSSISQGPASDATGPAASAILAVRRGGAQRPSDQRPLHGLRPESAGGTTGKPSTRPF